MGLRVDTQVDCERPTGFTMANEDRLKKDGQTDAGSTSAADATQEQYNYFYDRIYPLLKEGKLDFPRIAAKSGYKERRIRETLLFRLTSGEVIQLFGRKDGFCYICGYKTHSHANKEPVCLTCLKSLDNVIQEIHSAEISQRAEKLAKSPVPEELPLPEIEPFEEIVVEPRAEEMEMVPRAAYNALLKQLDQYQVKYGPLPSIVSGEMPSGEAQLAEVTSAASSIEPDAETLEIVPEVDPLLKMLKLNDQDVQVEPIESDALPELFGSGPIRHFGFQRVKGGPA